MKMSTNLSVYTKIQRNHGTMEKISWRSSGIVHQLLSYLDLLLWQSPPAIISESIVEKMTKIVVGGVIDV